MEQLHVLCHHTDALAQRLGVRLRDGDVPDANFAMLDVIKPEQESRQGGLATACASQHAQHFAGLQGERDVLQDWYVKRIAELNVAKLNFERAFWKRLPFPIAIKGWKRSISSTRRM